MAIVAGVDFGTLSVRVTLLDSERGRLGTASTTYPLHRRRAEPDFATQAHPDQMASLVLATREVLETTGIDGQCVAALALATTGSSVIPVDGTLKPLDEYLLWCDHRAHLEAAQITALAHITGLEAIKWCGGVYSHEWGFAKLLYWLRHNPELRPRFATALEHCDMVAATLIGITDPARVPRSICAMGHKWMWNPRWGGLPPQSFLSQLDPLFEGIREKLEGRYSTSDQVAGLLSFKWAGKLGLKAGIPIPVGAFDAHWDAIGAGCREGDVVNVVGTSTCIIAMSQEARLVPGVCGVVPGSVHPGLTGIEAGLSATGDIFEAIARRAATDVRSLSEGLELYAPGQTGLLRMSWDNGDRTVLVNSELGGVTLGWNLLHTAKDELFAAIEGTAFHTRIILERMAEHGVPVERVINAGGIPQNNAVLNQVYANVLAKPVLVPDGVPTSLGSGIFAMASFVNLLLLASYESHEFWSKGMLLKRLREEVLEANLELVRRGLVLYTFGNASGIDREQGLVVIKPSGVDYEELKAEQMVVTDLYGKIVEGECHPSSDLDTHTLLYREFAEIGAVVHTHSEFATSFAQAGMEIPALGTTHADYFYGPVPVTRTLSDDAIGGRYVLETGLAIVERFRGGDASDPIDPLAVPACLVRGHAPFAWGRTPEEAAHNAVVLEAVARMAYRTLALEANVQGVSQALLDRHYFRKHGKDATYGQGVD